MACSRKPIGVLRDSTTIRVVAGLHGAIGLIGLSVINLYGLYNCCWGRSWGEGGFCKVLQLLAIGCVPPPMRNVLVV